MDAITEGDESQWARQKFQLKKKSTGKKDKIDTWDYIKLNSFYTAKETIIRVGKTLEKMFRNHVFDIMG